MRTASPVVNEVNPGITMTTRVEPRRGGIGRAAIAPVSPPSGVLALIHRFTLGCARASLHPGLRYVVPSGLYEEEPGPRKIRVMTRREPGNERKAAEFFGEDSLECDSLLSP